MCQQGRESVWTSTIKVQIPEWDKGEFSHRGMEAIFISSPPKPGSAHEKYEQLMTRASLSTGVEKQKLKEQAELIRQKHLITVTDYIDVIHLPKDIALYYLSLCAAKAAMDGKRDLVAYGEKFTHVVFHDFKTIRGEVATSILQAYLPENFSNLDLQHLVEFRAEFATQRLKYEKEIQALVNEFAEVASEGQLDVLKERVVDIAKERIDETKKTYNRAKVEVVMNTLGVSLTPPALAASIASLLGVGIFAPAGIAAALSVFAAKLLLDKDKAKAEKSKSPWSYVLDVARMK